MADKSKSDKPKPKGAKRERDDDGKQITVNPSKKLFSLKDRIAGAGGSPEQTTPDIFQMDANKKLATAGESPRTPQNRIITRSQVTPVSSTDSKSGGLAVQRYGKAVANGAGELLTFEGGTGVDVNVDYSNGEYVLRIKRRKISSSTDEDNVEIRPEQTARSAGMLLLQAELIREMGEQLLAQHRASIRSIL